MNIEGMYEIEKSKFYCYIKSVDSEKQAIEFVKEIEAKHPKATHNCYVWKVQENGRESQKLCDDGEPKGTAAAPMMNVFTKNNLNNFVCVVSRYFGGKKLGAGGLIRAYSKAVSQLIKK